MCDSLPLLIVLNLRFKIPSKSETKGTKFHLLRNKNNTHLRLPYRLRFCLIEQPVRWVGK